MRFFAHILLLICTMPGILSGSTGGGVLCIGEDGHIAIERGGDCAAAECTPGADDAECNAPSALLQPPGRAGGCGTCWDVQLLSSPILPNSSRLNVPDHALLTLACLSNGAAASPAEGLVAPAGRPPAPWCFGNIPLRTTVLLI